ncbi:MAG: N-acetylneuraminate synthase [Ferrovibrionaceae bacterium]
MTDSVLIIAEAGVNHNGDIGLARALVDAAVAAGADVVKFQTFVPEEVISRFARKAEYQERTTGASETQLDMVRKLALPMTAYGELAEYSRAKGITFLSTPFDLPSLDVLVHDLGLDTIKLASGEVTNAPLLLASAAAGVEIILSTGMSTLDEVREALGVLAAGYLGQTRPTRAAIAEAFADPGGQAALRAKVRLLHCTTEYPAPFADANLRAMDTLRDAFGLPVGFSDHTPGINIPIAAVARGAVIVEKHFTLDRGMAGPDHKASLDPAELKAMVAGIRQVEAALGDGRKVPAPSEIKNIAIARRSIVTRRAVAAGAIFGDGDLTAKRPGDGISPLQFWEILGTPARRAYEPDEQID